MRIITALSVFGVMLSAIAIADRGGSQSADAMAHHAGPEVSVNENGVIINGYDAVAYFTEGRAVQGRPEYSADHEGARYLFSSSRNRDTFRANPERFAPEYGGWCAYGLALGKKFPVDGEAWEIVDGKLYLNLDKDIQKKWAEDRDGFIRDADEKWPMVKETPADEL